MNAIILAQNNTIAHVTNVFKGAYTNDMIGADYRATDYYIHFNERGLREHGRRWMENLVGEFWTVPTLVNLAVRKTATASSIYGTSPSANYKISAPYRANDGYSANSAWIPELGVSKTDTFTPTTASKVRLYITGASDTPFIMEIEVYKIEKISKSMWN